MLTHCAENFYRSFKEPGGFPRGIPVPWAPVRRALANLALAGCSLVLFLALAEGLCRAFDLRPGLGGALANPPWLGERWLLHRDDYRERLAEAGFLGRYYDLYAWDRYTFYRLRPEVASPERDTSDRAARR